MTIYILLMIIMLMAYVYDNSKNDSKDTSVRSNRILFVLFVLIFLICALRSTSVGRDIPGYEKVYKWTKDISWDNYNYVYFENGYIFLMKICSAIGMSFQGFMAVCYVIILAPLYYMIKRYSKDKVLSVIIFICYMFFDFALTGLRQAISMSIAILGFMVLTSKSKWKWLYYIIIIFVASLFHKGAYICFLIIPFLIVKDIVFYTAWITVGAGISLVLRRYLFVTIKNFFEKDTFTVNAGLYIGFNLIMLVVLAALFLVAQIYTKWRRASIKETWRTADSDESDDLFLKIFMLSIVIALFFGDETSARSYMYYNQAMIVLLPNINNKLFDNRSKFINGFILIILFMSFFVWNTLLGSNFDITPYKFFWQ